MGKGVLRIATTLLLAVALLSTQEAEAQFLQKLAKGLEKVNDTLDKVEDGVEDIKNNSLTQSLFKKRKSNEKEETPATNATTTTESRSAQSGAVAVAQSAEPEAKEPIFDDSDFEEVERQYPRPYISANTKYMIIDDIYSSTISPVYEDIFTIKHGSYYSFWHIDGRKLFDADWEYCNEHKGFGNSTPEFNSGVASARHRLPNSTGHKVISLLYQDGSVRELDPSWKEVTTFRDGLAIVTASSGKNEYFYIDIMGKKKFPHLQVYGGDDDAMRPLCDGLRAYPATYNTWGFIDAKGNIVIQPKYSHVSDFSGGYAWVRESTQISLIDTTGKVHFTETNLYADMLPVTEDRFFMRSSSSANWTLYDITGKRYKSFSSALTFRDGLAVVAPDADRMLNPVWVINTSGERVRVLNSFHEGNLNSSVCFSKHGVAPFEIKWGDYAIINTRGDIVMRSDYHIAGFTDCGYSIIRFGDSSYGFISLSGEIVWIFSEEEAENWDCELRPEPEPKPTPKPTPEPTPEPTPPWPPVYIDIRSDAEGPKQVITTEYTVKVKCTPAEGGSAHISPSGTFRYGDEAMLHASPNEDWEVASVTVSPSGQSPKVGELFRVMKDMEITVKFIEKDDDLPPPFDGALQGSRVFDMEDVKIPIDIYAEMSTEKSIATPYGQNTYGFIVAMFNPRHRYISETFSTYIFAAPLRISGYHFIPETGERWLVADGGSFTLGNLKITPNDAFAMLWVNMIMAVNDFTSPELTPRHYRIEMLDYDEESGEFTCGRLQTFSSEYGWLEGGDDRLSKKKEGLFMTSNDSGIPADFFMGAKMKKSTKRNDVEWYPPLEWYDGDQSALDGIISTMKFTYGSYKSEYDTIFE